MRYFGDALVIALGCTLAAQVAAQTTFTVTGVCCSSYNIDGMSDPTLTVVRGQTYNFNLINCAFHPFNIQSTSGIGGTAYPNVGNNGGTSGTVTLMVPTDEPASTLFYQCGNHDDMNGLINVVDPTPGTTATSTPPHTPTGTPTSTATRSATATRTITATPMETATPMPTRTRTGTATPTQTPTTSPITTATPTATGVATLTGTPAATPSVTSTPTPTQVPCVGDCNTSGQVTIDELLTMVNITLGNADVSTCLAGDASHDGHITVDEILMAVKNALDGCTGTTGPEAACLDSGGTVSTGLCCLSTGDFPNTCSIGACGCPPQGSHEVQICNCGEGKCFGGASVGCVTL